jgi:hypothetical protein
MDQKPYSFGVVARKPSALLPVAMSVIALAVVLGHFALVGTTRDADEGAAAHIWQLLIAGQLPLLLFFSIRWVPRARRPALEVLALQLIAVLSAMAPVFFFHL